MLPFSLICITFLCSFSIAQEAPEAQQGYDATTKLNSWLQYNQQQATPPQAVADLQASQSTYEDEEILLDEGSHSRRKYRRKGAKRNKNRKRKNGKHRQKETNSFTSPAYASDAFQQYGTGVGDYYDDNEYYDRDDGYGAPHAPSYSAPSPSYEAPSYQTSDSYGAPSYGGGDDGFNDFLNALAAFLPIGLFLAAIPPNLITVSTKKKRSLTGFEDNDVVDKYHYPFMERINEIGFDRLKSDVSCQKRVFCEMSWKGKQDFDANMVQKLFSYMAILSPKMVSDRLGTTQLFEAAQHGNCSAFQC